MAHWLDLVLALALRRPRFFADGWGDLEVVEREPLAAGGRPAPDRIDVVLHAEERRAGVVVRRGAFESPEARLPAASRRARVQLLLPERDPAGAVLLLAASGDQGFEVRRRFAAPLVRGGIAALLLENPYYGRRRPAGQDGVAVRTVSDLVLMASTAVREGRALVAWLRERGLSRVCVSGYSMGGAMAAMIAATTPFPVAAAPLAPSSSPASVFTEGLLRRAVDLDALGGAGARAALAGRLGRYDVTSLPPPLAREAAIVVGASRDGVVPPADPRRIARHWGAELRWLDAGHASAVLRHGDALRSAIRDALARLA